MNDRSPNPVAESAPVHDGLESWLAANSQAPLRERASGLIIQLRRLDASGAGAEQRVRILAAFDPFVAGATRELDAIYAGLPQPLETSALEALNLSRTLALGAADSYQSAARIVASAPATPARPRLAPLVFKAMGYLAQAMRASYKSYSRVPDGAWKRMHELYLFSEQLGISTGIADAQARVTVAGLYGESLLLALTDPYRLQRGDIDRIESMLREIRAPLSLGRERPDTPAGRHFLVPCDEDAGPGPLRDSVLAERGAGARVFDSSPVVDALRGEGVAGAYVPGPERASLVAKLLALWENPPQRAFQREPAQGSVAICVGVKPIAHFVAHDSTVDGEAESRALREGITMPLRALPEDEGGQAIPIHEWAVINLSAGGLRVRRRAATAYPLNIGEVVGIRAPGKALWTIGVTRWITGADDGTTEFGVQFFAQAICAVWVRSAAAPAAPKLGLLVAEGEEGAAESLLTPPGTYLEAGQFELRGEGYRSRMKAVALVEGNAYFELFRVEDA